MRGYRGIFRTSIQKLRRLRSKRMTFFFYNDSLNATYTSKYSFVSSTHLLMRRQSVKLSSFLLVFCFLSTGLLSESDRDLQKRLDFLQPVLSFSRSRSELARVIKRAPWRHKLGKLLFLPSRNQNSSDDPTRGPRRPRAERLTLTIPKAPFGAPRIIIVGTGRRCRR